MSLADDIRHALPPPHQAGRPFLLGGLIISCSAWLWRTGCAGSGLLFTCSACSSFAIPNVSRPAAPGDPGAGRWARRVRRARAAAGRTGPRRQPRWRVSIFLSVLNVHVNRIPADGTVTRIAYRHGAFLNASLDKASDNNERNAMALRLPDGQEIAVVQIAGLIARRILCTCARAMRCAPAHGSVSSASAAAPTFICRKACGPWSSGPDDDRRRDRDRGAWRRPRA